MEIICCECKEIIGPRSEDYIVIKDDLWKIISRNNEDRFLCPRCMEKRLGRKLKLSDLKIVEGHSSDFPPGRSKKQIDDNFRCMVPCNHPYMFKNFTREELKEQLELVENTIKRVGAWLPEKHRLNLIKFRDYIKEGKEIEPGN